MVMKKLYLLSLVFMVFGSCSVLQGPMEHQEQGTGEFYLIHFDGNGNTNRQIMLSQRAEGETYVHLNANTFEKTGHVFAGWATSPDGHKVYNDKGKIKIKNTDITLYALWRRSLGGFLDPTFIGAQYAENLSIYSIKIDSHKKILIGGSFDSYDDIPRSSIARLNSDGTLDTSFNPGTGANGSVYTIALQPDGKILIGGYFTTYNGTPRKYIARLNPDGSLDETFDPGTGTEGTNPYINSIDIQPNGKILIGGRFTAYNGTPRKYIARLNPDGSLDETFDPGTGTEGTNPYINSIDIQPNGKILIGGEFTAYNGIPRNSIARLNSDGSLDISFKPRVRYEDGNRTSSINTQADGKILIGGRIYTYDDDKEISLARLNSDGTLDTTFDPGTTGEDRYGILEITIDPDGKILIGGDFIQYNGFYQGGIARILP